MADDNRPPEYLAGGGSTGQPAGMPPCAPLKSRDPSSVGNYELLGRLGSGGMGVAYLGRSRQGGLVVVKVIRDELADDSELRARLRREIEAMRLTAGPRTARLIEEDLDSHTPFVVLEFVPGLTLAERVEQQGALSPAEIRRLADQLIEALAVIHAAGVVHRDLKPGNIMLSPSGAQIIDFGVAELTESTSLTRTGLVVGSAGWLAPEQLTGDGVGPATDIHAWACVLVYASTGESPFGSDRTATAMYRVLHVTPEVPARMGEPLATLVRQSLAKDPAARPSLSSIIETLANPDLVSMPTAAPATVLPAVPPPPRPIPLSPPIAGSPRAQRSGNTWVWALGATVLVAFLLGAIFAVWSRPRDPEPSLTSIGANPAAAASQPAIQAPTTQPIEATTPSAPTESPTPTPTTTPTPRVRPATCADVRRLGILVSVASKKTSYGGDYWPRVTVANKSKYTWTAHVIVTFRSRPTADAPYLSGDKEVWGRGYDKRLIVTGPGETTTTSLARSYDRMLLTPDEYISRVEAEATADNGTFGLSDCPVQVFLE